MKLVYFCLKINVKFVLYRNFFLLYDFLSLEYLRLAGPGVVFARASLAQLAGELIAHKNHIKERNIYVKQSLHWFLCISEQLLFIQVVFILIWNPPYYLGLFDNCLVKGLAALSRYVYLSWIAPIFERSYSIRGC